MLESVREGSIKYDQFAQRGCRWHWGLHCRLSVHEGRLVNTIKEPKIITLPVLSYDQFQLALLLSDLTPKIVYFSFVLFFELVNLIFLFPQPVEEKNQNWKK